jgi:hypothetical protein
MGVLVLELAKYSLAEFDSFFLLASLVVASVGSAVFSRWKTCVLIAYLFLATLSVVYFMNARQAVVMTKRMIYLLPFVIILSVGGIWCAIRLLLWPFERRVQWMARLGPPAWRRIQSILMLAVCAYLFVPVVKKNLSRVFDQYYREKEMYQSAAELISVNLRPGDVIVTTKNWDWVLYGYSRSAPKLQRLMTSFRRREELLRKYERGAGIWSLHASPEVIDVPPEECVRIPFYRGSVYLARREYGPDQELREKEAKRLLRNAVVCARMPEIRCATNLLARYKRDDEWVYGVELAAHMASFHSSREACTFAHETFRSYGRTEDANQVWYGYADRRVWEAGAQRRAARLAYAAGEYRNALGYNRLHWLLTLGEDALSESELGLVYFKLGDCDTALDYFTEHGRLSLSNVLERGDLSAACLECLKAEERYVEYISLCLDRWQHARDPSAFQALNTLLDGLREDRGRFTAVLDDVAEKDAAARSLAEFAACAVAAEGALDTNAALQKLKPQVGCRMLPLYAYLVDQFAHEDTKDALELSVSELAFELRADQVRKTNMRIADYGWASKDHPCFIKAHDGQTNLFAQFAPRVPYPGRYRLRVLLSTTREYPFDVDVNGQPALAHVGAVATGSLNTRKGKAVEVGVIDLERGTNTITIRVDSGRIQHINGIRIEKL